MPNWCENSMMINGDPDEVGKLLSFIEEDGRVLSFNKIIVMPPQLVGGNAPNRDPDSAEENLRLYGAKDWYDWSNKYWGTKWNANHPTIVSDVTSPMLPGHRTVKIQFDTAWAPPTPVYEALSKQFPNTNIFIKYNEPGVGFCGWAMYRDGELRSEQIYEQSEEVIITGLTSDAEVFDLIN